MIIVFTSCDKGGVVQFAESYKNALVDLGEEVVLFAPRSTEGLTTEAVFFDKPYLKTLLVGVPDSVRSIICDIEALRPEIILFADNSIPSTLIAAELEGDITKIMFMHDVTPHPGNKRNLRFVVRDSVANKWTKRALRAVDLVATLSESGKTKFDSLHSELSEKTVLAPLCPHPPKAEACCPLELEDDFKDYLLFFGRIEPYKGIGQLLEVMSEIVREDCLPLVIAGGGSFSSDEQEKLAELEGEIIVINRFIPDGEMVWLYGHSKAVVMPYTEASQSGVLALAYYYGKPVIVSNLPGLTEFVDNGVTGFVFNDKQGLRSLLLNARTLNSEDFSSATQDYVKTNLEIGAVASRLLSCARHRALEK